MLRKFAFVTIFAIALLAIYISPATAISVTKGNITVNTTTDSRPYGGSTSPQLYWVDIYKNGEWVLSYNPVHFSPPQTIVSENSTDCGDYIEIHAVIRDNDSIDYDVYIEVYDKVVLVRAMSNEKTSYGSRQNVIHLGSTNDTILYIIPKNGVTYEGATNIAKISSLTAGTKLFGKGIVAIDKNVWFGQVSLLRSIPEWKIVEYNGYKSVLLQDYPVNEAGINTENYPYDSDWIAFVMYDSLYELNDLINDTITNHITVKPYPREKLIWFRTLAEGAGAEHPNEQETYDVINASIAVNQYVGRKIIDAIEIDEGWEITGDPTRYDSSKFPNGLKPITDYAHANGLKVYVHVRFADILSKGIYNCVDTWKSWGLDGIKLGFFTEYVYNNKNPKYAVAKLRELVQALYENNMSLVGHEFRGWGLSYEYQNYIASESGATAEQSISFGDIAYATSLAIMGVDGGFTGDIYYDVKPEKPTTPMYDLGVFVGEVHIEVVGYRLFDENFWRDVLILASNHGNLDNIDWTTRTVFTRYIDENKEIIGISSADGWSGYVNFSRMADTVEIYYSNETVKRVRNVSSVFVSVPAKDGVVIHASPTPIPKTPKFEIHTPLEIHIDHHLKLNITLLNLEELYDYEILIDTNCDGVPDIVTKNLSITLPKFSRPAKYKLCIEVQDPVTGAFNKSEIFVQVYSLRLFRGYNIMNTTGAVIYAESSEPIHAVVKPIKVTQNFTVIVSEEDIYTNETGDVILNVTFVGLAGGDKVWLNETVVNARTVDLLHNGEPLLLAIPVENRSVNLTLTSFSTYTLVVNNTVAPMGEQPPPEKEEAFTIEEVLALIGVIILLIAIIAGIHYISKKAKVETLARMESKFKFFRRLK